MTFATRHALIAFVVTTLLGGGSALHAETQQTGRPNIVLILADDLGRELLAPYGGSSYDLPHLEQLAADGLTFETCYATPLCSPSRVELMTSQYSFRSYTAWGEIDRNADTFVRRLRDDGYQTFMAGKWHMSGWDETPLGVTVAGFEKHCSYDYAALLAESMTGGGNQYWGGRVVRDGRAMRLPKYGPDFFVDTICDAIDDRDASRPFFAYVPLNTMHRPFFPTPDHPDAPKAGENPPAAWMGSKGKAGNFGPMLQYADKLVGRLLSKLTEQNIDDNTLVVFTSDNGTDNVHEAKPVRSSYRNRQVAGGKYFPTELGLNVPLIVRWPAVVQANSRSSALTDFTDIGVTLCAAAKVDPPQNNDGHSLLPILRGENDAGKPFVWSWGNYERSSRRYKEPAAHPDKLFSVVRGKRFKWVSKGQIYDLTSDWFEESPIPPASSREVRKQLKSFNANLRRSEPKKW